MIRRRTKRITVRGIPIGDGAPISVQSMTNTRTEDVPATLSQIARLREAGCDIVSLAVRIGRPPVRCTRSPRTDMPLVADIF
jgi:(E)-4-hydroxy-3-methylbut-2-enyl-diphosphate synthase